MVAKRLGDIEELVDADPDEAAEGFDIAARSLIAGFGDDLDRPATGDAAVADFEREIVEEPGEPEFVPLQPVMD